MAETESNGAATSTGREETISRVPAAFLVQLAASQVGLGPFAERNRETPFIGARRYYEGLARRGVPRRLLRSA